MAFALFGIPLYAMAQQSTISALSQSEVRLSDQVRVTHTMGEPAIRRVEGDNQILLTEGFQQGVWKLGTGSSDQASQLHIYPNPTGAWVKIEFDESALQPEEVVIRHLNGSIISRTPVRYSGQFLDLSALTPGQYLLQSIQSKGQIGPSTPLIKH